MAEKWHEKTENRLAAALFAAVALLYFQMWKFDLLHLDDIPYIIDNATVNNGLTLLGIKTVFSKIIENYYIPVTWLSLMADADLYNLNPGGFHFTNLLLHATNCVLLFFLLNRLTGSKWKSFIAAALWALHPLRVEAVAWITSRKDLLSAFFLLNCLFAYAKYAKTRSLRLYFAALALFALGLMSKPILVTLPLLLIAFDLWPLGRFAEGGDAIKRLSVEKIPFAVLAAGASWITMHGQQQAVIPGELMPLTERLADMATSYSYYIYQTLWPVKLVVENRLSSPHLTGYAALFAGAALFAVTLAALWKAKKAPFATFGWFWYLIAIFPVSGVIPVGLNFTANRFTYLPAIGLSVIAVWGAEKLIGDRILFKKAALGLAAAICCVLFAVSYVQASYWKDGVTLFTYCVKATKGDPFSHRLLGTAYFNLGQYEKSFKEFIVAEEKQSMDYQVKKVLGLLLYRAQRNVEARDAFLSVLKLRPYDSETIQMSKCHVVLVSIKLDDKARATSHLCDMLAYNPKDWASNSMMKVVAGDDRVFQEVRSYLNSQKSTIGGGPEIEKELAMIAAIAGQREEMEAAIKNAMTIPHIPDYNVGIPLDLLRLGKTAAANFAFEIITGKNFIEARDESLPGFTGGDYEAMRILLNKKTIELAKESLKKQPSDYKALFHVAWCLSELGQFEEAEAYYKMSIELQPVHITARYGYGLMLAKMGRDEEAEAVLSTVIADSKGHSGANFALGQLNAKAGKLEFAVDNFLTAYESDPSNQEALFQKAMAQAQIGLYYEETALDFLEYIKLKPDDIRARYALGVLYGRHGATEKAIEQLKEVIRLNPKDVEVREMLSQLGAAGR